MAVSLISGWQLNVSNYWPEMSSTGRRLCRRYTAECVQNRPNAADHCSFLMTLSLHSASVEVYDCGGVGEQCSPRPSTRGQKHRYYADSKPSGRPAAPLPDSNLCRTELNHEIYRRRSTPCSRQLAVQMAFL